MANLKRFQAVERDFAKVAAKAGLPEPDEVNYRDEADEVEFIWHEQKLCVVVELDDYSNRCAEPEADIPF